MRKHATMTITMIMRVNIWLTCQNVSVFPMFFSFQRICLKMMKGLKLSSSHDMFNGRYIAAPEPKQISVEDWAFAQFFQF